jgi:uncharacterized protein DUF4375
MESLSAIWPIGDVPSEAISIYDGPDAFLSDFAKASRVHQVIFAAGWLQGEVLNGGLTQFFANDTGVLAPEAAAACRTLGMPKLAEELEKAMSWFGAVYPRQRNVRTLALENHAKARGAGSVYQENPFGELDERVAELIYSEGSGLEKAALEFVGASGS